MEILGAHTEWARCRAAKTWGSWPDTSLSRTSGHVGLTTACSVKHTSKVSRTLVQLECCCDALGAADGLTLTSKTARDSAIKTPGRLHCLAFQFKWFYGLPDTISPFPEWHPFVFSPLSVRQRSGQKAQRKWSVLLDSPDGDAQDSWSFVESLCFYLGTFRPLLLCLASPKAEEAIKPTARYKHSGRPEADAS